MTELLRSHNVTGSSPSVPWEKSAGLGLGRNSYSVTDLGLGFTAPPSRPAWDPTCKALRYSRCENQQEEMIRCERTPHGQCFAGSLRP